MRKFLLIAILLSLALPSTVLAETIYKNDQYKFSMKIYPEYVQSQEFTDFGCLHVLFANKFTEELILVMFCGMADELKSSHWEFFDNPDTHKLKLYSMGRVISKRKIDKTGCNGFSIIAEHINTEPLFVQAVYLFPKSKKEIGVIISFIYNKENESKILDMIESIEFNY